MNKDIENQGKEILLAWIATNIVIAIFLLFIFLWMSTLPGTIPL